ncbi:MAG: His/Gly/Thr/Pro-type tRNA ligase C-terminal domain-containing protein [Flavobacterium sp.]
MYHEYFLKDVQHQLFAKGVRVEIDDRNEKIGKKIRDTELLKVPYMLVIGEKEATENKVSIRRQGKGDAGQLTIQEFTAQIVEEIFERKSGE